jgi:hypothetical protein
MGNAEKLESSFVEVESRHETLFGAKTPISWKTSVAYRAYFS